MALAIEQRASTAAVTADFFLNCHSRRQFSGKAMPMAAIKASARIAQKALVACNRQSGRIHLVVDSDRKPLDAVPHVYGTKPSPTTGVTS